MPLLLPMWPVYSPLRSLHPPLLPSLPSASLLSPRHIFLLSTLVEFSPSPSPSPPRSSILSSSVSSPQRPRLLALRGGNIFQEISVHGDDSCRRGGDTAHGLCRLDKLVAPLSLLLGWPRMRISGRGTNHACSHRRRYDVYNHDVNVHSRTGLLSIIKINVRNAAFEKKYKMIILYVRVHVRVVKRRELSFFFVTTKLEISKIEAI